MGVTTDRNDPRLGYGVDEDPVPQNDTYLVLSDDEIAKGFVRPFRDRYVHVGPAGPQFEIRDLTEAEKERYPGVGYVKYEPYPEDYRGSSLGRFWTQEQLDAAGKGCGAVTTMGYAIAATYARTPNFYGATYCVGCHRHRPVGQEGEFVWEGTEERVGT